MLQKFSSFDSGAMNSMESNANRQLQTQEYQLIKEKESLIYGSQNTNAIYSSHMSGMEVIAAPKGS